LDQACQHPHQWTFIAAHAVGGCTNVLFRVHAFPPQPPSRVVRELGEERALCAAVPIAEWVDGVDLGEVVRESAHEPVELQVGKVSLGRQLVQQPGGGSMYCGSAKTDDLAMATVLTSPAHG